MNALAQRLPRLLDLIAVKPFFNIAEASILTGLLQSQLYAHARAGHVKIVRGKILREDLQALCDLLVEDEEQL